MKESVISVKWINDFNRFYQRTIANSYLSKRVLKFSFKITECDDLVLNLFSLSWSDKLYGFVEKGEDAVTVSFFKDSPDNVIDLFKIYNINVNNGLSSLDLVLREYPQHKTIEINNQGINL